MLQQSPAIFHRARNILLQTPHTALYVALLSLATLGGAIVALIFVIGIVVQNGSGTVNDGGQIFGTAIFMLALTLVTPYMTGKKTDH